jgi:hypothetical protein
MRTEDVLKRVKEDTKMLQTTTRRIANWIGHTLRMNFLRKHIIERKIVGNIKVTGRRQPQIDNSGKKKG